MADCDLRLAAPCGLPERDTHAIPVETMIAVHVKRRQVDRPWLFRWVPVRRAYLRGVEFLASWTYRSWLRYLRRRRPDAVVLWNGHRMPESAVKCAADALSIPVIHIENGHLPNTRTVDARGVNAFNSVPRNPGFFRARRAPLGDHWDLVPRPLHPSKSPGDVPDSPLVAGGRLPQRYVFVPFQVDTDSQLLLHSPHVANMRALFNLLEAAMQQLEGDERVVVFKEHPTSRYVYPDLHERSERNPRLQFCNSLSTRELIEKAETVVTINSTVGIEALLFRKRVVTLGNAFYNVDGLARQATNAGELAQLLGDRSWYPDDAVLGGLIDYLRNDYCVPMNPARNGEDDWQAMANRVLELATTGAAKFAERH